VNASITKYETTVSDRKCEPEAILAAETRTPNPTAADVATRLLRLSAFTSASEKKAPAASPDENEQLRLQLELMT
jgi:hypothetical protein